MNLHTKFLFLVLGSLVIFLGILSAVIVQREANLLANKTEEMQHLLTSAIVANLKDNMMHGRPRSTLDLLNNLRGLHGLVRLDVLQVSGTPAFGGKGQRYETPQFTEAIKTHTTVHFREPGNPPLETIIIPLNNEADCRQCHATSGDVLGLIILSLSMQDSLIEIGLSSKNLTTMLTLIIFAIGGILYLVIRKVVLTPLTTLHEGAERFGRGELGHRIAMATGDELQDVAAAFNAMAHALEASHASLESRISERTAQLQAAMSEVQDKAVRLYSYSHDMATISRLSARVFNAELSLDELLDHFMWSVSHRLGYTRSLLCLVDRKKVWLEIKRNNNMSGLLAPEGVSLQSRDPMMSLIRNSKIAVLDSRTLAPLALRNLGREDRTDEIYLIPLLSHSQAKRCWQQTSCIKTDCPAYSESTDPCWLMDNTLCNNQLVESYGDKLAYCMTCTVFPVIGALIIQVDPAVRPSRSRNIGILRILAAEMAAALENHRLHEANQRMVRELLELHRVTAAALSDMSLTRALEVFSESALTFSGLDAASFWLAAPNKRELLLKAGGCTNNEEIASVCPDRVPADAGLIGQAFQKRSGFVLSYNVPGDDATAFGRAASAHGMPSLLAAPLLSEDGPLGVFVVHKRGIMPFLEVEIAAFMLLANQAAMAINVCILNEELKNQNRELARRTGLLSGILANMASGILLLDEQGVVALINDVGAGILRSVRESLVGRRLEDLFPETHAFFQVEQHAGPYRAIQIRMRDGSSLPVGFSSTYYRGPSGAQEGIIVVFRDLSEIRELQAELLNKERFAAMGRVVAGVAHEIRNPLFGISSVGQIFERELTNPAHLELVRALLSETKRMNQLVEELLLYGRPMKLNLALCDVRELWQEVLTLHQDAIERRGIRLRGDLDTGPVSALIDANQVRQVFLNLLRNAIDATPEGGEIAIRLLLEDRFIVYKVIDTGIGIPAENLGRIFDLFFTTKPKGTGLGLAICKKIVQDHGGDITVESTKGGGTSVTVKLPYRSMSEQQEFLVGPGDLT